MNQERILVVEDELKIAELHQDYLKQSGFQVSILGRGDEVVSRIQKDPADLILLDLMLPGKSGEEVCRELRTFSNIPIIMITAKTEEIDRLLGLDWEQMITSASLSVPVKWWRGSRRFCAAVVQLSTRAPG